MERRDRRCAKPGQGKVQRTNERKQSDLEFGSGRDLRHKAKVGEDAAISEIWISDS